MTDWVRILHRRYLGYIALLGLVGLTMGLLSYAENVLIEGIARALTGSEGESEVVGGLVGIGARLGWSGPVTLLACFGVARMCVSLLAYQSNLVKGMLERRGRDDLEGALLQHLLRLGDSFYASRSPGEIINRLGTDVLRVGRRRILVTEVGAALAMVAANVAFFATHDLRLALAALLTCGGGALLTSLLTRPVAAMDKEYLYADDRSKGRFEDLLGAVPELQVGALFPQAHRYFAEVQDDRSTQFMRFVRLRAAVSGANKLSYLLALVGMLALVLLATGEQTTAVALLPVVLKALPDLFSNASRLVFQQLEWRRTRTSIDRLLEYESSPPPLGPDDELGLAPIRMEGLSYRYPGPDGTEGGGISGITGLLEPGTWTAVVGPAGSGKSTLMQILVGRLHSAQGTLSLGTKDLQTVEPTRRAGFTALMPQRVTCLDSTLAHNLGFGLLSGELGAAGRSLIEELGLGRMARDKALDMAVGELSGPVRAELVARRAAVAAALADAGIELVGLSGDRPPASDQLLDVLLAGRSAREACERVLSSRRAGRVLRLLAAMPVGLSLHDLSMAVLNASQAQLGIEQFETFRRLAPFPLSRAQWELRRALLARPGSTPTPESCRVALHTTLAELEAACGALDLESLTSRAGGALSPIRRLLGESFHELDRARVHPHLSWQENLLFGEVSTGNRRERGRCRDLVISAAEGSGEIGLAMTLAGLEYRVGKQGENLSGGQRQLVALARCLLRETGLVVLDEPSSALDPASTQRVAAVLRQQAREGRIVVTVTHDPGLVLEADAAIVLEAGHLAQAGPVEALRAEGGLFRRLFG